MLSSEAQEIEEYIKKYRTALTDDVFNSQSYSVKLIQIPKVSNTNRSDLAINFINWNELTADEKGNVQRLTTLIKDKTIKIEGANVGKLTPKAVMKRVQEEGIEGFSIYQHTALWKIFNIRPGKDSDNPFETDINYCHFDEVHKDYVFNENWVSSIINLFNKHGITIEWLKSKNAKNEVLTVIDYR